jgi:hypothetical protein
MRLTEGDEMQKFHVYVKNGYVGSTIATLADIKAAFPWSEVTGTRVDVWAIGRG